MHSLPLWLASSLPARYPPDQCPPARLAALARLRALVGARAGVLVAPDPGAALAAQAFSTGIAALDRWLRGWPRQGVVELTGAPGAGRMALVVPLLERLTGQGRPAILVDPLHQVYPPGLGRVDLARLVLVRPPGDRTAWVAEQVARSGAVEALILVDTPPLGRGGVRLARAAEAGGMLVFVLVDHSDAALPASLRIEVCGWQEGRLRVRCTRSRDGRMVGERLVSMEPPSMEPPVSSSSVCSGGEGRPVGAADRRLEAEGGSATQRMLRFGRG